MFFEFHSFLNVAGARNCRWVLVVWSESWQMIWTKMPWPGPRDESWWIRGFIFFPVDWGFGFVNRSESWEIFGECSVIHYLFCSVAITDVINLIGIHFSVDDLRDCFFVHCLIVLAGKTSTAALDPFCLHPSLDSKLQAVMNLRKQLGFLKRPWLPHLAVNVGTLQSQWQFFLHSVTSREIGSPAQGH